MYGKWCRNDEMFYDENLICVILFDLFFFMNMRKPWFEINDLDH